jgi:hypothetical protein
MASWAVQSLAVFDAHPVRLKREVHRGRRDRCRQVDHEATAIRRERVQETHELSIQPLLLLVHVVSNTRQTRTRQFVTLRIQIQLKTNRGPTRSQDMGRLKSTTVYAHQGIPQGQLVSSIRVESNGASPHERVSVWTRGALAGELTVGLGDGELLAQLFGLQLQSEDLEHVAVPEKRRLIETRQDIIPNHVDPTHGSLRVRLIVNGKESSSIDIMSGPISDIRLFVAGEIDEDEVRTRWGMTPDPNAEPATMIGGVRMPIEVGEALERVYPGETMFRVRGDLRQVLKGVSYSTLLTEVLETHGAKAIDGRIWTAYVDALFAEAARPPLPRT